MKIGEPHERRDKYWGRLCGAAARTNDHQPCRAPAMKGKDRCRLHGGKTPVKHGLYTRQMEREKAQCRALIREAKSTLRKDL